MDYAYTKDFESRLMTYTSAYQRQCSSSTCLCSFGVYFGWMAVWVLSPDSTMKACDFTDAGTESLYGVRAVHPRTDDLLVEQGPISDRDTTSPVPERTQHPLGSFLSDLID